MRYIGGETPVPRIFTVMGRLRSIRRKNLASSCRTNEAELGDDKSRNYNHWVGLQAGRDATLSGAIGATIK